MGPTGLLLCHGVPTAPKGALLPTQHWVTASGWAKRLPLCYRVESLTADMHRHMVGRGVTKSCMG